MTIRYKSPRIVQIRVPTVASINGHYTSRSMEIRSPIVPSVLSLLFTFSVLCPQLVVPQGNPGLLYLSFLREMLNHTLSIFLQLRYFVAREQYAISCIANDHQVDSERSGKAAKDGSTTFLSLLKGCFHW